MHKASQGTGKIIRRVHRVRIIKKISRASCSIAHRAPRIGALVREADSLYGHPLAWTLFISSSLPIYTELNEPVLVNLHKALGHGPQTGE